MQIEYLEIKIQWIEFKRKLDIEKEKWTSRHDNRNYQNRNTRVKKLKEKMNRSLVNCGASLKALS